MGLYLLRPAPRPVATDLPYRSVSRRSSRGRLAKLEFTRQHDACGNTVPSGGTDAAFTQILLADLLGRGLRQRGDEFDVARPHERGDRKSVVSGQSVSVRVDIGGRRFMKKK